jgi:cyclase
VANWRYHKGLHDLGNGCFAYLQPDGSWGWSNAGLIHDGDRTLLVDTLFELNLTRDMLGAMRRAVPAATHIDRLVNTHADGDHCYGNQLIGGAEIIASQNCLEDYRRRPPEVFREMVASLDRFGEGGAFMRHKIGTQFNFDGIVSAPPTRVFEGTLDLAVGGKSVRLVQVGPAHSNGDVLVLVPGDRTVFTGDILFVDSFPAFRQGPVANWISACDLILSWDVEIVVPGHGPITDKAGVARLKFYFEFLRDEARKRFDAGMDVETAASDIAFEAFRGWGEAERIVMNVATLYREFRGERGDADPWETWRLMSRFHDRLGPAGEAPLGRSAD